MNVADAVVIRRPVRASADTPVSFKTIQRVLDQARLRGVGAAMYGALGIGREDNAARADFTRDNRLSFDAPVLLLCHFPKRMKEAQWSDVGMWLQTLMLLLRGEGLDSCPREHMGLYGRTIKCILDCLRTRSCSAGWRSAGGTRMRQSTILSVIACRWLSRSRSWELNRRCGC